MNHNFKKINFLKIKLIMMILTLMIFLSSYVSAETITRDVEIKIILEEPEPGEEYTKIFRVENIDHQVGTTDLLHFYVNATLKNNNLTNNLTKEWNATRSINKYTETGLGTLTLETGKYELCVKLKPLNFHDPNITNNEACKTIITRDYESEETQKNESEEMEEAEKESQEELEEESELEGLLEPEEPEINVCDCKLEIITEKNIYEEGETISFIIRDCWDMNTYKEEIEYWAEDLFGEITKNKLKTISKNAKSYTPRIQEKEKTFTLKARINECEEVHEKFFTIKNQEQEKKETFVEITTQKEAKPGDTIIIELKGYKAKTLKTLINIQLELKGKRQSESLKTYIQRQNTEFHFKIPFKIPNNLPEGLKEYEIIAEGLDTEVMAIILINTPFEEIEPKTTIKSFYTRKQKFDDEINVIITWEGSEETTLRITTQEEIKEIEPNQTIMTIPVKIRTHNETIIAELIQKEETKDIKLLKLNLELDETKENSEKKELDKTINEELSEENYQEKQKTQELITKSQELITTEEEQLKELKEQKTTPIPTSKITAMTKIMNNAQEYKKQTIFLAIAIASLIFLFKKEIKQTLNNQKNRKKQKIKS